MRSLAEEVAARALLAGWSAERVARLRWDWGFWSRPGQRAPAGDWSCWLILAGRGFGKTRAGAEWVRGLAEATPGLRIALVGASFDEVRAVMVEGESGLLAIAPPALRPRWEPSRRTLSWPNGARAFAYSAAEPEGLRGPVHHFAWADEIGKWPHGIAAWDNLMMGLRLGTRPRVVATTTPRATALVKRLVRAPGAAVTRGRMRDNAAHLPIAFRRGMEADYGGTRLGRQELDGELFEEVEGALWTRGILERAVARGAGRAYPPLRSGPLHQAAPFDAACGVAQDRHGPPPRAGEDLVRVVVGVDPPASADGDACGIVAAGVLADGTGLVIEDASVAGRSPEGWAAAVAACARRHGADRIVAEANNGGAMVASVLRAADAGLPITLVHASRGKAARAEPIALLYEQGRVAHAAPFAELEDELCGLTVGGGYQGPTRSPDRADALVWALTELMLNRRATPRVRSF